MIAFTHTDTLQTVEDVLILVTLLVLVGFLIWAVAAIRRTADILLAVATLVDLIGREKEKEDEDG